MSTFFVLLVFGSGWSLQWGLLDLFGEPIVKKDQDKITDIGSLKQLMNFLNYSQFYSFKKIYKVQPKQSTHSSNGDESKVLIQQILKVKNLTLGAAQPHNDFENLMIIFNRPYLCH